MAPAVRQRLAAHPGAAAPDVEHADPLGSVNLVRAGAQQIDVHGVHVDPLLAVGLGGVGVKEDSALPAQGADARDRMQDAGLVVGVHDRHEQGPLGDRLGQAVEIQPSVAIDPQVGDVDSHPVEVLAGVEDGAVLGRHGDDVPLLPVRRRLGDPLEGQVVRLGGAAGPDDLPRVGPDDRRHLGAGGLDRGRRVAPEGVVAARRVPEAIGEKGQHRVEDPGIEGSRGVVVQVDHRTFSGRPGAQARCLRPGPFRGGCAIGHRGSPAARSVAPCGAGASPASTPGGTSPRAPSAATVKISG